MRNQKLLFILPALVFGAACRPTVNTLPPTLSPTAATQYYDLEVPADLEIKAVDFAASAFSDVHGPSGGPTQSSVGGRAFVKVYAEHRTTGQQFLLLYEDISRRKQPIQIIRFVGAGGVQQDSTRSPDGGA